MATAQAEEHIKRVDVFLPIEEGTRKHILFQIIQGEVVGENTNTEAVVVYKSQHNNYIAEGESMNMLQAAGNGASAEFDTVETANVHNERYVHERNERVVLTNANKLPNVRHLLHLSVENNPTTFKETLTSALRLCEMRQISSLSFAQLPLKLQDLTNILLKSIEEFARRDRPICLMSVQLYASSSDVFYRYVDALQTQELNKYREILVSSRYKSRNRYYSDEEEAQTKSNKVVAGRIMLYPDEIHAEVHGVNLHIEFSREDNTYRKSAVAYVMFREAPWVTHYSPYKRFLDIQPIHVTYKTAQNHTMIEITVHDDPGKFLRIKTVIQEVLRYADQHGIEHVIFPSQFHYGNHQIRLTVDDKQTINSSSIIPLLYFQAVCEFALFCQPSQLHIHIYLPEPDDDPDDGIFLLDFMDMLRIRLVCKESTERFLEVGKTSPFCAICEFRQIDPVFQACHLSVVEEYLKYGGKCMDWKVAKRYTHSCAVRRVSPFRIPVEMLLQRLVRIVSDMKIELP